MASYFVLSNLKLFSLVSTPFLYNNGVILSPFFILFHSYTIKIVGIVRIQTRAVGAEGKHSDHLTHTSTQPYSFL